MKLSSYLALILLILTCISCEEKIFTAAVDCSECYSDKPFEVELTIRLSSNPSKYGDILIILYKNSNKPENELDRFWVRDSEHYIFVEANQEYAAEAYYETSEKTIIALDGINQKLKRVSSQCDETCWVIENTELDLRLLYD